MIDRIGLHLRRAARGGSDGGVGVARRALALACAGVLALSLPDALVAQDSGVISGRVHDEHTAEPLAVVQVYIPSLGVGTLTNLDGRFMLRNVPPGTYEVVLELLGYAAKTVTGIEVRPGERTSLEILLPPSAIELEGVTVSVERERGATVAVLEARKKAPGVVDAIGAEQISRSPDGDAAAAMKRVPGVTVVDEKYVYVRGLGERYGATTLNGSRLPSPEVDKKVVPLDIIPSEFLEGVSTAKTYTPDQPGDYAGGLVQIDTRQLSGDGLFKLGAGFEYNSQATGSRGVGYPGGGLDFLGFEDGTRDLPSSLPVDRPLAPSSGFSAEELELVGEDFGRAWGPTPERHPVNQSLSVALGNQWSLFGQPLDLLLSVNHSNKYSHDPRMIERVFVNTRNGGSGSEPVPEVDYAGASSTHSVNLGGLFNASYELGPTNKVGVSALLSRTTDDEARSLEGFNLDSNTNQRNTRIRYIQHTLFNTQLDGEHRLGWLFGSTLNWRVAYSQAERYEPNTREVLYRAAGDKFLFDTFIQSGSIFHQELVDNGLSAGLDLKFPFRLRALPASLSVGAAIDSRDRDAFTRRFRFLPQGALGDSVRALPPDSLFRPENIAPDSFQVQEATFRPDNYDAASDILGAYLMVDAEVLPRLRFVGGGRLEKAEMSVRPRDLFATPLEPLPPAELGDTDLLPAVNLTYLMDEDMNLRLGFSRTLARPEFRELAPFAFADFAGGYLVTGNPTLGRSRIWNYDVRWEWFPRLGAVIAVSGFYKKFDDPIERFVFPSTELIKTWVNAEEAENYGLELEFRSSLHLVSSVLRNFYLNTNLTLVESNVVTGDTLSVVLGGDQQIDLAVQADERALQGQSPYVINAGITWFLPGTGTSMTVLYNRFGRRIDSVGGLFLADIYEEARDRLDLVLKQPFWGRWEIKLAAERLLGSEVEFTQADALLRTFDRGTSIAVGVSYGG